MGTKTLDFAFDIAFHVASVLIAKLQVQKSERDVRALVAKLRETKALGQEPVSKAMIGVARDVDPVAKRREEMQLIEGLLKELAP